MSSEAKRFRRGTGGVLEALERRSAHVALAFYPIFLCSLFPTRSARAADPDSPAAAPPSVTTAALPSAPVATANAESARSNAPVAAVSGAPGSSAGAPRAASLADSSRLSSTATASNSTQGSDSDGAGSPAASDPTARALPLGEQPSLGTAISLPTGPASVSGMGESYSAELSTGTARFSVPLVVPRARGKAQVDLGLSYSSGGGFGLAGVGWNVGTPGIFRQSDRGIPTYKDIASGWQPEQDRFLFTGAGELVPICTVNAGVCAGALAGERMPVWAEGWQYFRPRIESGYLRMFLKPNFRTWRVQSKSGVTLEFGEPLDSSGYSGAVVANPARPSEIYGWMLIRAYDTYGNANPATGNPAPANQVVYRYASVPGDGPYLTDVYHTPPAGNPAAPITEYAHHVRLEYETRPDKTHSYRSGFRIDSSRRLIRVDITSKPFAGATTAARQLLRRYHLEYSAGEHASLLSAVQTEGRCPGGAITETGTASDGAKILPGVTGCARLPKLSFGYARVASPATPLNDDTGLRFEPFNETVAALADSPPHSVDEDLTDLFDVNSDGLPDVVVTAPALFGGNHGLFLSGLASGATSAENRGFRKGSLTVSGVSGVDANTLAFDNPNVAPLDLDADGTGNLVHMPRVKRYSIFTPTGSDSTWTWSGREVTTASTQDPKIDFSGDRARLRVMDVNADGLVDIVFASATEYQTFFSLGRYPGGDGQFGWARWTGPTTAEIHNDPVTHCVPWSSTPVRLGDPDVQVADMNGDGYPDIVRMRDGDIRYWPGRGNGMWGTGLRDDCAAGTFGQDRHVPMTTSPRLGSTDASTVSLGDLNGDGLADLVEVRFRDVDIYLNVDGRSWTPRHTITNTPARPAGSNRVRITDIDGSGTPDILWGEAYAYKYIDLTGGIQPYLLTRVENGLGKTTTLEYTSSTQLMLSAQIAGASWTKIPAVIQVVSRTVERDNLEQIGRPAGVYVREYSYSNPFFDGRQREFRGFRSAETRSLGDANSPTSIERSEYLHGECGDDNPGDTINPCATGERWRDNPRESLKGLPVVSEVFGENGVYLSTSHTTYRVTKLYDGRDGRAVRRAIPLIQEEFRYDTASFTAASTPVTMTDIEMETGGTVTLSQTRSVLKRASAGTVRVRSRHAQDNFGNTLTKTAEGCVEGCSPVDESITTTSEFGLHASDLTGWQYRPTRTYVTGSSAPTARRNETEVTFDANGAPVESRFVLSGTAVLQRFHATVGQTVAPVPPQASAGATAPVTVVAMRTTFDAFGNFNVGKGANARCREVRYDPQYAGLATEELRFVGTVAVSGCGATVLRRTATHDRGFEVVLTSQDARDQPSAFEYDVFGRLTSATLPNPDVPGTLAPAPSNVFEYILPVQGGKPISMVRSLGQDGATTADAQYHESWAFVDGMGRRLMTLKEADPAAGDGGDWVASNLVDFDARGAVMRAYTAWFYPGSPAAFTFAVPASTPSHSQRYDAFARAKQTLGLDGRVAIRTDFHALSKDTWDAADIEPGPHMATPMSMLTDGHGRPITRTERAHVAGVIEEWQTLIRYLPTGEPTRIERRRVGKPDAPVVRWMAYDTQGRLVLNVDPDTTLNFTATPPASLDTVKAWRYAYNDTGDLVGNSDARGCGVNYHYDAGGRLFAEDYSPCADGQTLYTAPNLTTGDGTEVFHRYDTADPEAATLRDAANTALPASASVLGRVASKSDRASKTVYAYDVRGRNIAIAKRVAKPQAPTSALSTRYAARWYVRKFSFDGASRPVSGTTGATRTGLLGSGGQSTITESYTRRGLTQIVSGSYGPLITRVAYSPNGMPTSMAYGDLAGTERSFAFDSNLRLQTAMTFRSQPSLWSTPGPNYTPPTPSDRTTQLLLEDYDLTYDSVGNIKEIRDWRTPEDWPASAQPVTRRFEYDDLYRLTRTTYSYPSATDLWKSPLEKENLSGAAAGHSPHVAFDNRVTEQTWTFDWLGNMTRTTDDASGFYDRSLGDITNGTAANGPYQLKVGSNRTLAPSSTRKGDLQAVYDAAGNLSDLTVRRDGPCLPSGASCWQRFRYSWDEIGKLATARRWDLTGTERTANDAPADPLPGRPANVELRYAYDSSGDRVLKTARDPAGVERNDAYIFSTLELRRAAFTTDFALTDQTEVVYLKASGDRLAQVVFFQGTVPNTQPGQQHVLLEVGDHLGSFGIVVDKATSELVERRTYEPFGSVESDHRPGRWQAFREAYGFTGKEADIEVGLVYSGKRYYAPTLGRWISPDPVPLHSGNGDLNLYSYVSGRALIATDPTGGLAFLVVVAIGIAVGAAVAGGSNAIAQAAHGGKFDWGSFGMAVGIGAVAGGVFAATAGAGGFSLVGGIYSTSSSLGQVALGYAALAGFATSGGAVIGATAAAGSGADWKGVLTGAAMGVEAGLVMTAGAALAHGFFALAPYGIGAWLGPAASVSAGINGAFAGARGIYDWTGSDPHATGYSGWLAFGTDSTWAIPNTTIGNVFNVISLIKPDATYRDDLSRRHNRQVYHDGARLDGGSAFAQGNYIAMSNRTEGENPEGYRDLLAHETNHLLQSRAMGIGFPSVYVAVGVVGGAAAVGYWAYANIFTSKDPNLGACLKTGAYYNNPFEQESYEKFNPGAKNPPVSELYLDW